MTRLSSCILIPVFLPICAAFHYCPTGTTRAGDSAAATRSPPHPRAGLSSAISVNGASMPPIGTCCGMSVTDDTNTADDICASSVEQTCKSIIHFNNAGASPSPPIVVQTMTDHLAREVELGGYLAAAQVQSELDDVYASIHRLIHGDAASSSGAGKNKLGGKQARKEIALVESATVGWTRIFYSMAECLARRARKEAALVSMASDHPVVLERVILMSGAEYAANVVAAVKFCREQNEMLGHSNGARVRWRVLTIPSTTYVDLLGEIQSTGVVDTEALEKMMSGRWEMNDSDDAGKRGPKFLDPQSIAMVCVTHIPTNSGIINPVNEIGAIIEEHNARHNSEANTKNDSGFCLPQTLYLVDACQSIGQIDVNVRDMHCHALTATGRKYLRGPRGTGFLYARHDIADELVPSHVDHAAAPLSAVPALSAKESVGGSSIDLTDSLEFGYQPGAARFEFWESNVASKMGLGAAVHYALDVGMTTIEEKCCQLGAELRTRLCSIDGVEVFHDNIDKKGLSMSKQCGIVVFGVQGIDSSRIKTSLLDGGRDDSARFEVSVVPATSTPVDSARTMTKDLVRASLSYENTIEEIDEFVKRLEVVLGK